MSATSFLDGRVTLHAGDCRDVIRTLPDNSIDSVVSDPPYALVSIVKRFANSPRSEATENTENPYGRTGRGFMGQRWDNGETAFAVEFWAEVLRVLKPGGHIVAFSGTRTYHRMVVAIEDAGFEIRDQIGWLFGSGFPKSHNVSKGIDKAAGAQREKIATGAAVKRMIPGADQNKAGWEKTSGREYVPGIELPATDDAATWQGWGTALKPAWEPICLARKPLEGTVAANVLAHGTGALNIDGARVAHMTVEGGSLAHNSHLRHGINGGNGGQIFPTEEARRVVVPSPLGRFPANLIHDGSDEVLAAFPDAPGQQQDVDPDAPSNKTGLVYGKMNRHGEKSADSRYQDRGATNFAALPGMRRGDSGSAARFFYTAKADAEDRLGSKHPTVKPLDLIQYLCRLITPPGGTILDMFAGTGTTGEAAWREGFKAILIEREEEYQADIARRMDLATKPTKRAAVAKTKNKLMGAEGTPLFGGEAA